jgi:hypothetical protein
MAHGPHLVHQEHRDDTLSKLHASEHPAVARAQSELIPLNPSEHARARRMARHARAPTAAPDDQAHGLPG